MNWKAAFVTGLTLLFTVTLYAQTPDGITPANEDICDPLKGGTPGLYGLCVAFCEAQSYDGLGYLQLTNSQTKILKAYNKKKNYHDPAMPCFQGCPCFSIENAEFVASHQYFLGCLDYSDEELSGTFYERWQSIDLWGELNANGYAQVRGDVSAYKSELQIPPLVCNWSFHIDSPLLDIGKFWEGDYDNKADQSKLEDCQAIIDHVVDKYDVPCETIPECEVRILVGSYTRDDLFIEVNGSLINDPPEICVNNAPIARIEWYWGDGTMDTFEMMSDGYVYPFPNSHTYSQNRGYLMSIYAYDEDGKIIDSASRLFILW